MTLETASPPPAPAISLNPEGNRRSFIAIAVLTVLLAVVPSVLWPGAITWFWDEPVLVAQAYYYNHDHVMADRGLAGNFEIPYGPLATQMYQFMLLFTHDPRVMVVWHALIFSSILAAAILWLSRTLRLSIFFGIAILICPYVSWIERDLWDATCAIPVGALAIAAYADFLRTGRRWTLGIGIAGACLTPFVHMQGLPLFFAIVGHACWRHWRSMLRAWWQIALSLLPVLIVNFRYLRIFKNYLRDKWPAMVHNGYHDRSHQYFSSLFAPFTSGGLNFIGDNWVVTTFGLPGPQWLGPTMIYLSYIAMGLVWLGIIVCGWEVWRMFANRRQDSAAAQNRFDASTARSQIILICVAGFAMQVGLSVVLRLPNYPQYSFGTWPFHLLFAWFGVEWLGRFRLQHVVTAVYALAVGYLTIGGNWSVHNRGWVREMNCPTMEDDIPIAQQLNHYNNPIVYTDVSTFKVFPRAIQTLRLLHPPAELPAPSLRTRLYLRYQQNGDPRTQRVELVELGQNAIPDGAVEIDVNPENRWY